MFNERNIDSEEHFDPEFYKFATYQMVSQNYPYVGESMAAFNSLEQELDDALCDLINQDDPEIGLVVLKGLSFDNKMYMWSRFIQYYSQYIENDNDKIKWQSCCCDMIERMKEIKKLRNQIAHANWDGMNKDFFVPSESFVDKKGIKYKYLEINEKAFQTIINSISNLEDEFVTLHAEFMKLP